MIRINQTLQTPENCLYQTVTAALRPTSDQEVNSMLNHALETIEIHNFPPEIDLLAVKTNIIHHRPYSSPTQRKLTIPIARQQH